MTSNPYDYFIKDIQIPTTAEVVADWLKIHVSYYVRLRSGHAEGKKLSSRIESHLQLLIFLDKHNLLKTFLDQK